MFTFARIGLVALSIALAAAPAAGQPVQQSLNNQPAPAAADGAYRFLIIGHAYGRPLRLQEMPSHYPSSTLLGNIGELARRKPDLVVLLGDFIYRLDTPHFRAFDQLVMQPIGVPFFNAVGNHELRDSAFRNNRAAYENRFGRTFFSVLIGPDRHVFLDSELNDRSIKNAQLEFLHGEIDHALRDKAVRNIFFWSHRLIWTQASQRYNRLRGEVGKWNFAADILPGLKALSAVGKGVFWGSGNVGKGGAYSVFYDRDPASGVTYIATGLGDASTDAVIFATVSAEGQVAFEAIQLGNEPIQPIEAYGPTFWRSFNEKWLALDWNHLKNPPRAAAIGTMEKVRFLLDSRFFWYGVAATILAALSLTLAGLILLWIVRRNH